MRFYVLHFYNYNDSILYEADGFISKGHSKSEDTINIFTRENIRKRLKTFIYSNFNRLLRILLSYPYLIMLTVFLAKILIKY